MLIAIGALVVLYIICKITGWVLLAFLRFFIVIAVVAFLLGLCCAIGGCDDSMFRGFGEASLNADAGWASFRNRCDVKTFHYEMVEDKDAPGHPRFSASCHVLEGK